MNFLNKEHPLVTGTESYLVYGDPEWEKLHAGERPGWVPMVCAGFLQDFPYRTVGFKFPDKMEANRRRYHIDPNSARALFVEEIILPHIDKGFSGRITTSSVEGKFNFDSNYLRALFNIILLRSFCLQPDVVYAYYVFRTHYHKPVQQSYVLAHYYPIGRTFPMTEHTIIPEEMRMSDYRRFSLNAVKRRLHKYSYLHEAVTYGWMGYDMDELTHPHMHVHITMKNFPEHEKELKL